MMDEPPFTESTCILYTLREINRSPEKIAATDTKIYID